MYGYFKISSSNLNGSSGINNTYSVVIPGIVSIDSGYREEERNLFVKELKDITSNHDDYENFAFLENEAYEVIENIEDSDKTIDYHQNWDDMPLKQEHKSILKKNKRKCRSNI